MDDNSTMGINASIKGKYIILGIMAIIGGCLILFFVAMEISTIIYGAYALYSIYAMAPASNNVDLSDFIQKLSASIPAIYFWIFFGVVFLPLYGLGMSAYFLFQGSLLIWITKTTRVDIASEGIAFHSPGVALRSSWKNIRGVAVKKYFLGLRQYEALALIEPAEQTLAWWVPFGGRKPNLEIPLSVFADWRERELGQAAKQFAPWILGKDQS